MAELGVYQIPKEFKDEDKWFRFFTKKQLIFVGAALGIDVLIMMACYKAGVMSVGLSISEIILFIAVFFAFIVIPTDRYMIGGGYPLRNIVARVLIKRFRKNRVLYVKNYETKLEEIE